MSDTVVLVHGLPETAEIWAPLQARLERETTAVTLPGFGTARPSSFTATKDAYAQWLAESLSRFDTPVDVVGHDIGALITMRVASAFEVSLRSFVVDVAPIFHPRFSWPQRMRDLQTPGLGEKLEEDARRADVADPRSHVSRLIAAGVPADLAHAMGARHDEEMSRSILDFYRSAVPNVAADWWEDAAGARRSRGLVLLLPDPPEHEAMSLEVAERLGAKTARLDDLNHCWMAEAPDKAAAVLENFWATLEG
jgi:pimeloyl-ACP methyl ester carboxylesterase